MNDELEKAIELAKEKNLIHDNGWIDIKVFPEIYNEEFLFLLKENPFLSECHTRIVIGFYDYDGDYCQYGLCTEKIGKRGITFPKLGINHGILRTRLNYWQEENTCICQILAWQPLPKPLI
jgi:hypothetical protein